MYPHVFTHLDCLRCPSASPSRSFKEMMRIRLSTEIPRCRDALSTTHPTSQQTLTIADMKSRAMVRASKRLLESPGMNHLWVPWVRVPVRLVHLFL